MGLIVVLMLIGVLLSVVFRFLNKKSGDYKHGVFGLCYFVSRVFTGAFSLLLLLTFVGHLKKNIDFRVITNERTVLERLLEEDYDPNNLKVALEFNNEQKLNKMYNETFLWYCWDKCVSVDTIAIPDKKFVPSNYMKLEAMLEQIENKAEK